MVDKWRLWIVSAALCKLLDNVYMVILLVVECFNVIRRELFMISYLYVFYMC